MSCRWTCRRSYESPAAERWWALDDEIMGYLAGRESMEPAEIAERIGLSESAVASLLGLLVSQGRVRICRVAAVDGAAPTRELPRVA